MTPPMNCGSSRCSCCCSVWMKRTIVRVFFVVGAVFALYRGALAAEFDLLIDNALVVDGSGSPGFHADIAIRGDRIFAIRSEIDPVLAQRVLHANGLVASPGFIEPHSHISNIHEHPHAENFLRQGVTTLANTLHSVTQPYPLGEYVDGLAVAVNTVWTAGHSWIRENVMGLENRSPTAEELEQMIALVTEAMNDGAIGLGTGLEYVPANYAGTDEIIALALAAAHPNAIYSTHIRDEGAQVLAALDEALSIGRATSLPVHIDHLKVTGASNWAIVENVVAMLESASAAGQRVSFDVYPYTAYSTYSTVLFPSWALGGGLQAYRERIADPTLRRQIAREMLPIFRAQTDGTLDGVKFSDLDGFEGATLREYLRSKSLPETLVAGVDALIDLQSQGGFLGIFEAMSLADVEMLLGHPLGVISSDGSLVEPGAGFPHPRSYGSFPRVLGHYVRDLEVLTLEAAVAKMTSVSAGILGLRDRGLLEDGRYADITIFDPATVADRATFDDPHHYAVGIEYVIVNGVLVMDRGVIQPDLPGRPLKRVLGK